MCASRREHAFTRCIVFNVIGLVIDAEFPAVEPGLFIVSIVIDRLIRIIEELDNDGFRWRLRRSVGLTTFAQLALLLRRTIDVRCQTAYRLRNRFIGRAK